MRSIRHAVFSILAGAVITATAVAPAVVASPAAAAATVTTVEQTSSALRYTGNWRTSGTPQDSGGSIAYLFSTGSVAMTFTGTSVQLVGRATPSSGTAQVVIDGRAVATVDQYSSSTRYRVVSFGSSTLAAGQHTITVSRTGQKNSSSTGTNIVVDAFVVEDAAHAAPVLTAVGIGMQEDTSPSLGWAGEWRQLSSGSDSGGGSRYLNSEGSVSMAFTGKAIAWVSRLSASAGIADVYLDDVKVATIDRYSAQDVYQAKVFERRDLTDTRHTIRVQWTGRANPRSSGANLLVDGFSVLDVDAPSTPSGSRGEVNGGKLVVSWNAVDAADLAGYRVYDLSSGTRRVFGQAARTTTAMDFVGLLSSQTVKFAVSAIDATGNESPLSPVVTVTTGATPVGSQRYADCPAATVSVATVAELKSAIAGAKPGSIIRLAPGVYPGQQITVTARGTAADPIWICGPRTAVLDGGSVAALHGILVSSSSHVVISGMTVRNFLKGVTVRASDHVTVSDVAIEEIGYEAVHLRENTTDSVVVGSTITRTGRLDPFYGEGVYIGSSPANWCALTDCQPDRSDRNAIVTNTISATGSDPIEAKEGTTGGTIAGNIIDGSNGMLRAEAWVKIGGNGWSVSSNRGTNSTLNGFRVQGRDTEWGLRNVFTSNTATVNAPGYGFELYEPAGPGTSNTVIACDNQVTGAAKGHSNLSCTP